MTNEYPKAQERFCKDPDKHWFVLRITYGRVLKAHDVLSTQESIEVYMPVRYTIRNINGHKYLFTVNRFKNPVYLSGKPIAEGTSIYIQPNQEFVLGRTRFCLSK